MTCEYLAVTFFCCGTLLGLLVVVMCESVSCTRCSMAMCGWSVVCVSSSMYFCYGVLAFIWTDCEHHGYRHQVSKYISYNILNAIQGFRGRSSWSFFAQGSLRNIFHRRSKSHLYSIDAPLTIGSSSQSCETHQGICMCSPITLHHEDIWNPRIQLLRPSDSTSFRHLFDIFTTGLFFSSGAPYAGLSWSVLLGLYCS